MMKETNSLSVRDKERKTSSIQTNILFNGKEIRNPLLAKVVGIIVTALILGVIVFLIVPVFLAAVAVLILGLVAFYLYARIKLKGLRKTHASKSEQMTEYQVVDSRVPESSADRKAKQ